MGSPQTVVCGEFPRQARGVIMGIEELIHQRNLSCVGYGPGAQPDLLNAGLPVVADCGRGFTGWRIEALV
jgi:hypothetical protein